MKLTTRHFLAPNMFFAPFFAPFKNRQTMWKMSPVVFFTVENMRADNEMGQLHRTTPAGNTIEHFWIQHPTKNEVLPLYQIVQFVWGGGVDKADSTS